MIKKCLFTLLTLMVSASVYASGPVSGRYELNATGNHLIVDLHADGPMITGTAYHYMDGHGGSMDRHYQIVDGFSALINNDRYYVEFEVFVPGFEEGEEDQIFTLEGWQAENGSFIGGLGHSRREPVNLFPWYATRVADLPYTHTEPAPL